MAEPLVFSSGHGRPSTADPATQPRIAEETTSRFGVLVDFSGDAIIGATPSGRITSWNRAAVAMYGYAVEEAVGCGIDNGRGRCRRDHGPALPWGALHRHHGARARGRLDLRRRGH